MRVHFIVSGRGVINMFMESGDRLPPINTDHPNYHEIASLLSTTKGMVNVEELMDLIDTKKAIDIQSGGRIEIKDNDIYINGLPIPETLSKRLLDMISGGYTIEPFVKFCENLMENPSMRSVEQLFAFLEYQGLPITEDGHFLAYKGVRKDFKDKWTGKVDNSVGATVSMPRNQVLDDPNKHCGAGLHAGDLTYANGWAGTDGILVLVKVNPKDAVSVPSDGQKLRCCEYTVVASHEDRTLLTGALYTCDGVTADPSRFVPAEHAPINTNPASAHFEHEIVDGAGERSGGSTVMTTQGPSSYYEEDEDECPECGMPEYECECCCFCASYPCECDDWD